MKGFGIYIKNDLLDPKHVENMDSSYWLYTWCLDKMTSISEEGIGKVLGGRPVKYEELQKELGLSHRTYSRWIARLKKHGYINVLRAPNGLIISVNKAVKVFGNRVAINGVSDKPQMANLISQKGISNIRQNKLQNSNTIESTLAKKENPYKNIEDLKEKDFEEISERYQVPLVFVKSKYEDMILWAEERPNNPKLKGRNWRMTLMNWVKRDGLKIRKEANERVSKRGIDARGVQ